MTASSSVTPAPTLQPPGLRLRQVAETDVAGLAAILAEPSVSAWWPAYDAARVRDDLVLDDEETSWVIEAPRNGRWAVVGYIQSWEDRQPEFMHASIDLFVTSHEHGRGIGPRAIHAVARWLVDERGHHRLTIDPAADNDRAIRAYAKVGFSPVGRMRAYQRMADGSWADGLLMEQLDSDLRLELTVSTLTAMVSDARDACPGPIVVALDGRSGSGKSSLARALADSLGATIITGDDFYSDVPDDQRRSMRPEEAAASLFDWRRMRDLAVLPLRAGQSATYRPFDWVGGSGLSSVPVNLSPAGIIVVDGIYSSRPELSEVIDLAVLVDCPRPTRLQRLATRGHGNEEWHDFWEAAEDHYFSSAPLSAQCDAMVITGT